MKYTVYIPKKVEWNSAILVNDYNDPVYKWDLDFDSLRNWGEEFELYKVMFPLDSISTGSLKNNWIKKQTFKTIEEFKLWFAQEYFEHLV